LFVHLLAFGQATCCCQWLHNTTCHWKDSRKYWHDWARSPGLL